MYTVYVLLSSRNGRRYIGITENIERRIEEHNAGKTKSTRYIRPLKLVYSEVYDSRIEAYKREKSLKSGQGRAYLDEVLKVQQ